MSTTTAAVPQRRSVAGRAALALALLFGFYLIVFAIAGGLIALNVAMLAADRVRIRVLVVSAVVVVSLARGVFFVERRAEAEEVDGIPVPESAEPRLWALVRDVAAQLGTEPPARLYLVGDVNAFVFQRSRFLGLVPGERVMGIGLPLLEVLTVDELRAVLAHEYGHYTGGDTRLGPIVYRGRASIGRTIDHLGEDNLLRYVFTAYGKVYLRVSQAVSRRQELDADANAARLEGADVHASALRGVHVSAVAFDAFLGRYVAPLWRAGARPRDIYGGFRSFYTHPDHEESITRLAEWLSEDAADPYDSHPSLGERLAALGSTGGRRDGEPASTLLTDPAAASLRMSERVSAESTGHRALRPLEWDDSAAAAILGPVVDRERAELHAAVASVTGGHGSLAGAFDLVAAGRTEELGLALDADLRGVADPDQRRDAARDAAVNWIAGAVAAELTARAGYRWGLRWSRRAALVAPTGDEWAYGERVAAAVDDPAELSALRTELRQQGLDV